MSSRDDLRLFLPFCDGREDCRCPFCVHSNSKQFEF